MVEILTPPQLRVLARSLPVPRGRMATAGWGFSWSWSRADRIQPTYTHSSGLRSLRWGQMHLRENTRHCTLLFEWSQKSSLLLKEFRNFCILLKKRPWAFLLYNKPVPTHRAITSACQYPQVMHLTVHF